MTTERADSPPSIAPVDHGRPVAPPSGSTRQFFGTAAGIIFAVLGVAMVLVEWLVTRDLDALALGEFLFAVGGVLVILSAVRGPRRGRFVAAGAFFGITFAGWMIARHIAGLSTQFLSGAGVAILIATLLAFALVIQLVANRLNAALERRGWTIFHERGVLLSIAMGGLLQWLRALGCACSSPAWRHFDSAAWYLFCGLLLFVPKRVVPSKG